MAKKKKSSSPPVMMNGYQIHRRKKLLDRWGFLCVICGREFAHIACVTREHVVAQSRAVDLGIENIAPSHHQCNQLRGSNSIIATAKLVDEKERVLGDRFVSWLNKRVPGRNVPPEALLPLRIPGFLELPECLPGLP